MNPTFISTSEFLSGNDRGRFASATKPLSYEMLRRLCLGDAPKEELYDLDADPRAVKMRAQLNHWREFTNDRDIKRRTTKTTP